MVSNKGLEVLLPWWEIFWTNLSLVPASDIEYIHLQFDGLQLGSQCMQVKTAPLHSLSLVRNALGRDATAWQFVLDTIRANPTLQVLFIDSNYISSTCVSTLVDVLTAHPTIDGIGLRRCGMEKERKTVRLLISHSLSQMREVSLDHNCLGSQSEEIISKNVDLIARRISNNPVVEMLDLEHNQLIDIDAIMLASSLQMNTNLRKLRLRGNRITQNGFSALLNVLYNRRSLNRLSQYSNHTCFIISGEDTFSLVNNEFINPENNRRMKLIRCLPVATPGCPHVINVMGNLRGIPIGVVPQMFVFVQGMESAFKVNGLDATFRLMRHWNMPLLFTSSAGPYPRRSNRIRAKKVAQLMGK